ncbi:protein phosphatase 2C-like domain-containing protein 1 [Eudromia elegans]
MGNINNSSTLNVQNCLIKALSICQDKNPTWQGDLEDRCIVLDSYGSRSDTSFLGLVDGYHGAGAAEAVSAELPLLFLDQLAQRDSSYKKSMEEQKILDSFSTVITADYREKERIFSDKQDNDKTNTTNTYNWIHKAYAKSFWRMDRLLQLGRNEVSKVRWSGCSVLTCLVERIHNEETESTEETEGKSLEKREHSPLTRTSKGVAGLLHIANIGNIHAVLCKNGKAYRLSEEHSTSNVHEKKRILQGGGRISSNEPDGLVEGHLRTTRGLGYHGDPVLKKSVIPVPHTVSVPIDDSCQFLILASNGLWEVLDYHEVLALTLKTFTHYLRVYGGIQQNGTSLQKHQCLMPVSEEDRNNSNAIHDKQDAAEILQSNMDIFLNNSRGNLAQNEPRCSRNSYLYSEDEIFKDTDDLRNQADTESCPFTDKETRSQKRQDDTDSGTVCERCPTDQLEMNALVETTDTKQPKDNTKTYLSNCNSDTNLIEKVESKPFSDKTSSHISQQLVETMLATGPKPTPRSEEDTRVYLASCEPPTAARDWVPAAICYDKAAGYVSEHLVQTALAAGSRDNVTVLIVLLNGCDRIPNYVNT